jgi:hypothetical protein
MLQALIPVIGTLLDKVLPDPKAAADAKLKLIELAQAGELAVLGAEKELALAQNEINKEEAKDPNLFKSGWRPAAGWVCVWGLGYQFLLVPLLPWLVTLFGVAVPPLPALDMETLMGLLMGLLGLGGFRTFERIKGKV